MTVWKFVAPHIPAKSRAISTMNFVGILLEMLLHTAGRPEVGRNTCCKIVHSVLSTPLNLLYCIAFVFFENPTTYVFRVTLFGPCRCTRQRQTPSTFLAKLLQFKWPHLFPTCSSQTDFPFAASAVQCGALQALIFAMCLLQSNFELVA